jgi:hypothetical protein
MYFAIEAHLEKRTRKTGLPCANETVRILVGALVAELVFRSGDEVSIIPNR